jgi:hypothetical protein
VHFAACSVTLNITIYQPNGDIKVRTPIRFDKAFLDALRGNWPQWRALIMERERATKMIPMAMEILAMHVLDVSFGDVIGQFIDNQITRDNL